MSKGSRLNVDMDEIGGQLNRVRKRVQGFQDVALTSRDTETTLTANGNVLSFHQLSQAAKQQLGTNIRDVLEISVNTNTEFGDFENVMRRRNQGGGS